MRGKYAAALLMLLSTVAGATEVDSYTLRFSGLKDLTAVVDGYVNDRIERAIRATPTCDEAMLRANMAARLIFQLIGGFERHLIAHPGLSRSMVTFPRSIYRDFPIADAWVLHTVPLAMGPMIRVAGQYVGADKFGHFFTEGYELYNIAYVLNQGEDAALLYSQGLEQGFFGAPNTGIQSHGDQAANYRGMLFWRDFITTHVSCSEGRFALTSPFRAADYVDRGWDEAYNCNEYARPALQEMVDNRLQELSVAAERPLTCPMEADACAEMRALYGTAAAKILTPRCL